MFTICDSDAPWMIGPACGPDADHELEVQVPDALQKRSGFEATVRQHPHVESRLDAQWDLLKEVQSQACRGGGAASPVDAIPHRELQTAIDGVQHHQVETEHMVVHADVGQGGSGLGNAGEIDAQPELWVVLPFGGDEEGIPLGLDEDVPAIAGCPSRTRLGGD